MPRLAPRAWLVACLLAVLVAACRSPDESRNEIREKRDAFEAELDADS